MVNITIDGVAYPFPEQGTPPPWGADVLAFSEAVGTALGLRFVNPMTTNGDIVIRAGGVAARLAVGSSLQVLGVSAGLPAWVTVFPSSSTDNAIVRFDGTSGKTIQNSGVTISDVNSIAGVNAMGVTTVNAGDVNVSSLTASRALQTDASKNLQSSSVTTTELGYLSGVTGPIQSQINAQVSGPVSSTDNALVRFNGTGGNVIQNSAVIVDDSNNISAATITPISDVTSDLGSTSKNWKGLYLDNGATDGGAVNFNAGTTSNLKSTADGLNLELAGFTSITPSSNGLSNLGSTSKRFATLLLSDDAANTAAVSTNRLYANLIPKAWAVLTFGVAGSVTVTNGVNIASASWSTSLATINLATAMANTNYIVLANSASDGGVALMFNVRAGVTTTTQFQLRKRDNGGSIDYSASDILHILVFGQQ